MAHGQAAGFNGYNLIQTFNNRLQPGTVLATSPSSTLLDFTYDFIDANGKNNGNVDAILNNRNHNRDFRYTYDELNRIKTAQSAATSGGDCWGLQYGFDIYANLLSASVTKCSETALSLSVNTNNRITGLSYDLSGNTTNDGSFTYTWDAESRMKSGAGVNYTYDADGRRVKKSNGKLYWYGIGAEPLAESDLSGNVSEEYIFFGGKRIARRVVSPSSVSYYFADHLGTSRVIVQANATTACYEADFTPYGKERVITNTCPQNYKFTGKERDSESTLDYFGARFYSWGFGRFHSPDLPFIDQHLGNPQSWNLYAYARNNPLIYIDPTGNAVDGPMGGSGMLPGVHHGGGVDVSMLSGVNSHSWTYWYIEVTVVGGETKLGTTTKTSEEVQEATQPQGQQIAQGLSAQVPPQVKQAIGNSVKASNSPTADDKKGGFHEEGGVWGTDAKSGELLVSPAKPGPVSQPGDKGAHMEVGNAVDPSLNQRMIPQGNWHVHPKGGGDRKFVQPPSGRDQNLAVFKFNIVVGASNNRVYFYNGSRVVGEMSLKEFMKGSK